MRLAGFARMFGFLAAALLAPAALAQPAAAPYAAPKHDGLGWPGIVSGETQDARQTSLDAGPELQRGRSARWTLAEHRRLSKALAAIQPQRKGVVDVYVIAIALDSDPVFGRETREAGKVLSRRYGATGRTIVLAGSTGAAPSELPLGSMESLTLSLARVAEVMDPKEDVLVLYSTSHGAKIGLAYHDGDEGFGLLTPTRYAAILNELGIKRRVLILSACYSGIFVPALSSPDTALFTAASDSRPSFGCMAENDWTFFGDAMINHGMRKPQSLAEAGKEAHGLITQWEAGARLQPSNPQVSIGANVETWLKPLEARIPKLATQPVGKPAAEALKR
ncbi:C13 family peptidase [Sphingomonas sp. G-3-2-10]|uniref:C13 family peptidase n=1 Tax=Sphingomonas sp. G-3-2-10 TaxID=2728838 RepID=UPI00146EFC85|nr:C13 family peptidase [Sphingomonas sp. G-3-2-10]NML06907.1 peptidase C13 [Sphingomonas sp. G-3-2-10]